MESGHESGWGGDCLAEIGIGVLLKQQGLKLQNERSRYEGILG
jgi:hypothetical protein